MPESPEGRRNPALKPKPQNSEPAAQDGPSHTCAVKPPQVTLILCCPLEALLEAFLCPAAKPELSSTPELFFLSCRVESPAIHAAQCYICWMLAGTALFPTQWRTSEYLSWIPFFLSLTYVDTGILQ